MATEKDFTAGDWQRVEAAPFMAGLAITYGDLSNKVAIGDEASATGEAIKAGRSSSSEIVRAIAARFAAGAAREGGFIGIGITKVSEGEQLALATLALGLPA